MQKVHMLGIGGAGMAALAAMLIDMGLQVSGYDQELGDTAKHLQKRGIVVDTKGDYRLIKAADFCVYSTALLNNNGLLQYAKQHLPTFSRGEMMGLLSQQFAQVAAVAGTHGKTTVSGMLTTILLMDGQNPSTLMGGHLPILGGNGRLGSRKLLVCEACEYKKSFLHLKRDLGILLNIDNDHLECYGSMDDLKTGFGNFIGKCNTIIVCADDQNATEVSQSHPHRLCFSANKPADCYASQIQESKDGLRFILHLPNGKTKPITLQIHGKHNILNALAAATAAWQLGADTNAIEKGLASFRGVSRRFEILYENPRITVADDYAHHPAEIESVLSAVSQMGFDYVTAVFQPFTYSRTLALHREFAKALSSAHRVILTPIMGGREPNNPHITSQLIATHLPQSIICNDFTQASHLAAEPQKGRHLILTMGCGNVYRCAQEIVKLYETKHVSEQTA